MKVKCAEGNQICKISKTLLLYRIPLPLRTRSSLFEASNLDHIEEKRTESIGHLGIEIL